MPRQRSRRDELEEEQRRAILEQDNVLADARMKPIIPKCNYTATAAPAVTNDLSKGYTPGSIWVNTTGDKAYICVDATVGAAVWRETSAIGLPGSGSMTSVKEAGSLVGTADAVAIDFGAGFDVAAVGTDRDVTLDLSEIAAGGELAGFMDAPTVDATHSGSAHHNPVTLGDTQHTLGGGQVLSGVAATASQAGHATAAQITKLDGIAAGADVTSANAPKAHAASHVAGDAIQDATAAQTGLATAAQITKLDGIEAAADVTDAGNVNAAGAVMESDFNDISFLYATTDNTPQCKNPAEVMAILSGTAVADFAMGGHKITGLAAATATTQVMRWDETPKLAGQLGGTVASPAVIGITTTTGPTALTLGAIADGEYLKRVGATVVSGVPAGGAVATDVIWDALGDLAVGTGANTAAKLTAGANDTILMAQSGEATGLKWVASAAAGALPAVGDAAGVGTADTFARSDHGHTIAHAITDNAIATIDGTTNAPANLDYAKWTTLGLEGKSYAEVATDLKGTDLAKRVMYIKEVVAPTTALTTGDAKTTICIPVELNGWNLVQAEARVYTVGTGATLIAIQIRNVTDGHDMLAAAHKITIDASELTSYTAADRSVVDTAEDDVVTADIIAVDIDAINNTVVALGLDVILTWQLP